MLAEICFRPTQATPIATGMLLRPTPPELMAEEMRYRRTLAARHDLATRAVAAI
jgi:hypothetical protein